MAKLPSTQEPTVEKREDHRANLPAWFTQWSVGCFLDHYGKSAMIKNPRLLIDELTSHICKPTLDYNPGVVATTKKQRSKSWLVVLYCGSG